MDIESMLCKWLFSITRQSPASKFSMSGEMNELEGIIVK